LRIGYGPVCYHFHTRPIRVSQRLEPGAHSLKRFDPSNIGLDPDPCPLALLPLSLGLWTFPRAVDFVCELGVDWIGLDWYWYWYYVVARIPPHHHHHHHLLAASERRYLENPTRH
jgi:hypothetical protein